MENVAKRRCLTHEEPNIPAGIDPWLKCPNEVIQLIAAATGRLSDIKNLSRASRRLYDCLDSYMYLYDYRDEDQPGSMLLWACLKSKVSTVEAAARAGVDMNMSWPLSAAEAMATNQYGSGRASWIGYFRPICKAERLTPLAVAIATDNDKLVQLLLDQGVNANLALVPGCPHPPIILAVMFNSTDVLSLLLSRPGLDTSVRDGRGHGLLRIAIKAQSTSRDAAFAIMFHFAHHANCLGRSVVLPKQSHLLEKDLLIAAVRARDYSAVALLLEADAVDPNAIEAKTEEHTRDGSRRCLTPLMAACEGNIKKMLDLLGRSTRILYTAPPSCADGKTLMQFALDGGFWESVRFLFCTGRVPVPDVDELFETVMQSRRQHVPLLREVIFRTDMLNGRAQRWKETASVIRCKKASQKDILCDWIDTRLSECVSNK